MFNADVLRRKARAWFSSRGQLSESLRFSSVFETHAFDLPDHSRQGSEFQLCRRNGLRAFDFILAGKRPLSCCA